MRQELHIDRPALSPQVTPPCAANAEAAAVQTAPEEEYLSFPVEWERESDI